MTTGPPLVTVSSKQERCSMPRVKYTEKAKAAKVAKANELHDAGKSWDEAAKAAGIARLTLFNWMHPKTKTKRAKLKAVRQPTAFVAATDGVVEAVLKTPAAQKAMLLKIQGWVERELAKL